LGTLLAFLLVRHGGVVQERYVKGSTEGVLAADP